MAWPIYEKRETVAQLGTVTIALLAMFASQNFAMHQEVPVQDSAISLTLVATEETPALQTIQPPQPEKVIETPKEVTPVAEAPSLIAEQVIEKSAPATPVEAVAAQPQAVDVSAEVEATYVAKVRSYLFSIKRYPTSREARLQRPVGQVELWFVLARNGRLMDAGIEHSSHSLILDAAALSTLRGGSYPSFPEEVWAGETSRRFTVVLEYLI